MSDDRILRRVRALLAKAESTEFEDEALALTAKAHELMAAHAIDRVLIEEADGAGELVARIVTIAAPYPKPKYVLLAGVARANGCRAILGVPVDRRLDLVTDGTLLGLGNDRLATLVGHVGDVDDAELLFTSLLVQATNVMVGLRPTRGSVRAFRHAFLIGFAESVRARLDENRAHAVAAAGTASVGRHRGGDVLPVLASRQERVDAEVDAVFPSLRTTRATFSSGEGLVAGQHAGHRADVGHRGLRRTPALGR